MEYNWYIIYTTIAELGIRKLSKAELPNCFLASRNSWPEDQYEQACSYTFELAKKNNLGVEPGHNFGAEVTFLD
jgi:hypothetical protein